METRKIKSALQDLIYRLHDAEKGYREIERAISNPTFKKWLKNYALERHNMHRELEKISASLGYKAEVDTTFLGDLHRIFIDVKVSNTSSDKELEAAIDEIKRGANFLISDYSRVLKEISMPATYVAILNRQKQTIESEVNSLIELKKDLEAIPA